METAIKKYIEKMIPELTGKIHPVFTTVLDDVSVVYVFVPISGGHLRQSQLELKIIGSDYDECKNMAEKLIYLLDMEEDEAFVSTDGVRFHSEISGGGTLFNEGCQMYEDTLYFILNWRKR